jgi:hypothetical protein
MSVLNEFQSGCMIVWQLQYPTRCAPERTNVEPYRRPEISESAMQFPDKVSGIVSHN